MALTDAQYEAWLRNPARDNYRVLLAEIKHNAGAETLRVATLPYVAEVAGKSLVYDDFIDTSRQPAFSDDLSGFVSVGDFYVVNPEHDAGTANDWLTRQFAGEECTWLYGDTAWDYDDFRPVLKTLTTDCRSQGGNLFVFDIMDAAQNYRRTWDTGSAPQTYSGTASSILTAELTKAGFTDAIEYENITTAQSQRLITVTIDDNTILIDFIQQIANSIGAYLRINPSNGKLVLFRPDNSGTPVLTITEDIIVMNSVNQIDEIPAYKYISIELGDGSILPDPLVPVPGVETGAISEQKTVSTYLQATTDADDHLAEITAQYSVKRAVFEIEVLFVGAVLKKGDLVAVESFEFTGNATIRRIVYELGSIVTRIEVVEA